MTENINADNMTVVEKEWNLNIFIWHRSLAYTKLYHLQKHCGVVLSK